MFYLSNTYLLSNKLWPLLVLFRKGRGTITRRTGTYIYTKMPHRNLILFGKILRRIPQVLKIILFITLCSVPVHPQLLGSVPLHLGSYCKLRSYWLSDSLFHIRYIWKHQFHFSSKTTPPIWFISVSIYKGMNLILIC